MTELFLERFVIIVIIVGQCGDKDLDIQTTTETRLNLPNFQRRVQNIHWSAHVTLEEIYGYLPPFCVDLHRGECSSQEMYCFRAEGEAISCLASPLERKQRRNEIKKTYLSCWGSGLRTCMWLWLTERYGGMLCEEFLPRPKDDDD